MTNPMKVATFNWDTCRDDDHACCNSYITVAQFGSENFHLCIYCERKWEELPLKIELAGKHQTYCNRSKRT